jgi:hypothetical protein
MPPELRILEGELLYRVRQRINDGRLPLANAPSVSAGYAAGSECCAVCDQQIASGQVSYEVPGPAPMVFHRKCYIIWQHECEQRIGDAARRQKEIQLIARKTDAGGDTDVPERLLKP